MTGRMWMETSPWNQPLGDVTVDVAETAILRSVATRIEAVCGPEIMHVTGPATDMLFVERDDDGATVAAHQGRVPFGRAHLTGDMIVVDHIVRTVVSGRNWRYDGPNSTQVDDLEVVDLDSDGWGSDAAGLVLERELVGTIDHAIAVLVPSLAQYGLRLRLDEVTRRRLDPIERTFAAALTKYGAVVVGESPTPAVQILIERSGAASPGDAAGPIYRQVGIAEYPWPLRLPVDALTVVG